MGMTRAAAVLEVVGAVLVCVSIWMGHGIAVAVSSWLGGLTGGVFLILYAAAMER